VNIASSKMELVRPSERDCRSFLVLVPPKPPKDKKSGPPQTPIDAISYGIKSFISVRLNSAHLSQPADGFLPLGETDEDNVISPVYSKDTHELDLIWRERLLRPQVEAPPHELGGVNTVRTVPLLATIRAEHYLQPYRKN
jgi:hypothetical protein